ncbi:hypothetical protein ROZALSC1DRAFT_25075, partial [Rozella allomycis CSF55]
SLGHLFGTGHDPNNQECNPNGIQYIMAATGYSIAINTINGQKYSPCSIRNIQSSVGTTGTCFVTRNSVPSFTFWSNYTTYWYPHPEDQCKTMEYLGVLPALVNDSWTDFVPWDINNVGCTLHCTKVSMGSWNETTFPNPNNLNSLLTRRNGTPCDENNPAKLTQEQICVILN